MSARIKKELDEKIPKNNYSVLRSADEIKHLGKQGGEKFSQSWKRGKNRREVN